MNKRNLQQLILALVIPVLYIFSAAGFNSVSERSFVKASRTVISDAKDFLNVIFNIYYLGTEEGNWVERNLPLYRDSLNYNGIQIYDHGSERFGEFDTPLESSQITNVTNLMSDVEDRGLKGFYARTNITWLAEAQRLEYEVSENGSITVNDGFCYQNIMDNTFEIDSGRTVLHAKVLPSNNNNSPGWLCDSIYENMQHSDYINQKDTGNWFIKPMMRIDTSDFDSDDTTRVVAIVTKSLGGTRIDSVIIKIRNFRNSDSTYSGNYINEYNFTGEPIPVDLNIFGDTTTTGLNHGSNGWLESSKVDFKIYWFGQVDVWFDKMTVDDELGNRLFNKDTTLNFDSRIRDEVTHFTNKSRNYTFYCDEAVYSQIPCLEYISNKMHSYNDTSRLSYVMSDLLNRLSMKNDTVAYEVSLDKIKPKVFFADPYMIPWEIPNNVSFPGSDQLSPSAYNDTLQRAFGFKGGVWNSYENSFIKQVDLARRKVELNSPESKFFVIPQLFGFMEINNSGNYVKKQDGREPTNEEIQTQAMLSISHGAAGLGWFIYQSSEWNDPCSTVPNGQILGHYNLLHPTQSTTAGCTFNIYGLFNKDSTKRTSNVFGQNKWDYVAKMNKKILNWKLTLDLVTWQNGYSVHSEGAAHNFISDIKSIKRDPYHEYIDSPPCVNCDAANERYWEMGFFDPDFDNPAVDDNDKSKYFMMVNRRCVPDTPTAGQGDFRQLRIKFDSTQLSGFTNWKIIDLDTNNVVSTFNKNTTAYINMGEFKPGEGKLYKLAPVMQEGGTLVTNEVVSGVNFNCNGNVFNNGKNVTINPAITVNFAEGVKWDFYGGEFKCGNSADIPETQPVILTSQSAPSRAYWKGIILNQCSNVEIENTVMHYVDNQATALQLIDCAEFNINHNTFNLANLDSIIAIGVDYITPTVLEPIACDECEPEGNYALINNNVFNTTGSILPTLRLSGYSSLIVSLMADGNTFNSTSGSLAVFLSNVAAGNIKNNKIFNFKTGINILSSASYADFYNNTIYGDSIGIQINNGTINLGLQAPNYTGGFNRISASNIYGNAIKTVEGHFGIANGLNTFNITNDSDAYHLGGTFNVSGNGVGVEVSAEENCFTLLGGVTTPRENVGCTSGINCEVIFQFDPTVCAITQTDDYFVIDVLGDSSVFDTIWINGEGVGGSMSNVQLSMFNEMEIAGCSDLYNSICIEMRKRNYELVHTKCLELLNNYIDSTESMDALSKLYLADLILDSSGNKITELKSFFETLILQNGDNESLVKKLFYLTQKCKVALGEYESAITGFQEIINQNPYNYEGLVASWDYAATSLLSGGQGGGERDLEFKISDFGIGDKSVENISKIQNPKFQIFDDDPKDKYDSKKFTKEDRKVIRENVINSFQTSREIEIEKIKSLERKVSEGNASKTEISELKVKKTLGEVIKVKKPRDITEHINNVNGSIQKVFGSRKDNNSKEIINIIPTEYSLSQNYPNPFNPVTKINIDLPQDGNVKLIIYDLLGREIVRLLNNEFKVSGRHTVYFNGSNLSSGIYFYKLEADDFIATKKMVLLK